jgi:hypothetical protein
MTRIIFIHTGNRIESTDAGDDASVMHKAVCPGVPGIVAEFSRK